MKGRNFRDAWKRTADKNFQTRCSTLINSIVGMNLCAKNESIVFFSHRKALTPAPLYIPDASGFDMHVQGAVLSAHSNSAKICVSASVLVALQSELPSRRWSNCLSFLGKFQWHFMDFDFEDFASEAHLTDVANRHLDESSRIAVACALEMKSKNTEFPTFLISSSRSTQQVAARRGLLVRVPSEESVHLTRNEFGIFSEAVNHLSTREKKILEKKN